MQEIWAQHDTGGLIPSFHVIYGDCCLSFPGVQCFQTVELERPRYQFGTVASLVDVLLLQAKSNSSMAWEYSEFLILS